MKQPARRIQRMLVDVVCLRRDGAKLQPEELRAAKPVRALLTIDTATLGLPRAASEGPRSEVAWLWRPQLSGNPRAIDALACAQVSRVGGDGLLVVGVESRGNGPDHPQAWWCRVVLDSETIKTAMSDTSPR